MTTQGIRRTVSHAASKLNSDYKCTSRYVAIVVTIILILVIVQLSRGSG